MFSSTRVLVGSAVVVAFALVALALGLGGVFTFSDTKTPTSIAEAETAQAQTAQAQTSQSSNKGMYPFGKPSGGVAINVPRPPGSRRSLRLSQPRPRRVSTVRIPSRRRSLSPSTSGLRHVH